METLNVEDRRVCYIDEGAGDDAVVLLHGFPLDSSIWQHQLRTLAGTYRLVVPDLAGCGASDPPTDPHAHTIDAWADDVISILAASGLDGAVVAGVAEGADVALAITRRWREGVLGLLLANLRPEPVTAEEDAQWSNQIDWIEKEGDTQPLIDRLVDEVAPGDSPSRSEAIKWARVAIERTSPIGWIAGLEALRRRPDVAADAHRIDVPTMVVAAEHDRLASSDDVRRMAEMIPDAGFVELDGVGRLPNIEAPAQFERALADVVAARHARRPIGKHSWPASPATAEQG